MTTASYQPGVCNIGPAERRRRRRDGWLGAVLTVLALIGFVVFRVPDPWRLLVFAPAVLGAVGFLQSAFHFCVGFAALGRYNMGLALGSQESVADREMRLADLRRAALIGGLSALIAAAVVVVALLLP